MDPRTNALSNATQPEGEATMTQTTATPQAWIGCLAAYNAGTLHGEWIDAVDTDELDEGRKRVLASSPVPNAEEAFIADYDGFGSLASTLGEYPSYETVATIGAGIEEHGDAFALFVATCEPDLETLDADDFYQHYRGEWDSEEAFAYETIAELGWAGIEGHELANSEIFAYLDMEMITRELFQHGPYISATGDSYQLHVFEPDA